MVRREAAALAAVVLLTAGARAAEREESLRAAAAGACAFAHGVADAEADVLLGPELFGRYGGVNLVESIGKYGPAERRAWLKALPEIVPVLADRWSLRLGPPFQPGGQTAWVAPARDADDQPVVLKVSWCYT